MRLHGSSSSLSGSTALHWASLRNDFPVTRKWAYFDHAAVAAIPRRAHDRMKAWLEQALFEGDAFWPEWSRQFEALRTLAAQLIHAHRDEIALVPNTSFGINMISEGYPWQRGDNVVMPAGEFPSNVYPWLHLQDRGVEVRQVALDGNRVCLDSIARACDGRTRIVTASWVGYASGYRLDPKALAQVAHDAGALFFLDAIQGLGVFPLDVEDAKIDFLAADGHKWMCGPEGAGVFYLRKEHLERIRAINVGWNSVAQGNDYTRVELNLRDAASRYESGTQNLAGFIGLLGALETLQQFGLGARESALEVRVLEVSDYLCQRLREVGATVHSDRSDRQASSGIVLFELPGIDSMPMKSALYERGVVVSCRAGKLRAACHAYNNEDDVERLVDAVQSGL